MSVHAARTPAIPNAKRQDHRQCNSNVLTDPYDGDKNAQCRRNEKGKIYIRFEQEEAGEAEGLVFVTLQKKKRDIWKRKPVL